MAEEGAGDGGAGGENVNEFDGGWAEAQVGETFGDGAEGAGRRDRGAKGIDNERTRERAIE